MFRKPFFFRLSYRFKPKKKQRHFGSTWINTVEKSLLRVMVLGFVLLTLFQFRTITDPVDFYLKIAGDIDSPAFKYEDYLNSENSKSILNKSFILEIQAKPESSVLVKQNDKVLGIVGQGLKVGVEPGTVYLDATNVYTPVTVSIILNDKVYEVELNNDIKSFEIGLAK